MTDEFNKLKIFTLVDLLRYRKIQQPKQLVFNFLVDGETEAGSFTYEELNRQARAIAAYLQSIGATGGRALLLYPPGLEFIAAFFGCLYAGVVAVPVYPPRANQSLSRLRAIVTDAQAAIALTTTNVLANIERKSIDFPALKALHWLATDNLEINWEQEWQPPAITSDTLAFLQYTSGSTGNPKGVMLSHSNLLHNSAQIQQFFGHTPNSHGVIWLPSYHDMGLIGGIIQPVYSGFPTTLMSPVDFLQQPLRWLQAITRYKGTTSGGPNFAYDLCVRKITPEQRTTLDLSSWEVAFNGAEPIRHETLKKFTEAFEPYGFRREAFYSCYGLAEATLIVSGGKKAEPPIVQKFQASALAENQVIKANADNSQTFIGSGQAGANQRIAIANPESLTQCLPNQVGEIWVSGPSIAQGYWQRPEETKHTFCAYLSDTGKGPFLRTGDLGFLHNGELFVTGRLKDLIIIRGRNHYPQDIELTVEQSHPALRSGCGAAFAIDVLSQERLVVVQEIERRYRNPNIDEIVTAIRQAVSNNHELQVYAVLLVKTGTIPKTSSGKIQRHACRNRFLNGSWDVIGSNILEDTHTILSSPNLTREALLAIEPKARQPLLISHLQEQVAQVLRIAPAELNPQQSLSTLGLDSLMAIEIKNDIETNLGVVLPITQFLQSPNIEQLAIATLTQLTSTSIRTIAAVSSIGTEHPLSYGQRALWFLHQLAPTSPIHNIASAVRVQALDILALQRAFQILVERHPALRTTFDTVQGEPIQQIHEHISIDFLQENASNWSKNRLNEQLLKEAYRPFNLKQGPLLRVSLFTQSSQEHILLLVIHHIVSDFWSLAVLVQELGILYQAQKTNTPAALAPLTLQYTDYVRSQAEMLASPEGEKLWAYWQKQLAGELPVLNLRTDQPRPPVQTYQGAVHTFKLSKTLTQEIKAISRIHETTLYTTLLAAFQVLLYRYTDQEDILVGSPTTGRNRAELAGLLGYFVNPVVMRANLAGNPTFEAFLNQVRSTVLDAFAHQDYPFAQLVERLQPIREPSRSPIFQAMFVLQKAYLLNDEGLTSFALGETGVRMNLGELELESFALQQRVAQFDLTLMMAEVEGGLTASFEYNTDLFTAATINRLASHFQTLLESIVAQPKQCIANLLILTATEQHQLLVEWNDTQTNYSEDQCIHELFAAQVERTPDAIAVVFGNKQLTYRELNNQANQLAQYLEQLGVQPEVMVGICVERSLDMVVGLLGILKAGGVYIPLDPTYPQERLAFMLEDTNVPVLLTQQRLVKQLPAHTAKVICLDSDWTNLVGKNTDNPNSSVNPDNLAYVIYTSGSTGKPKGVAIQHRSTVTFINWAIATFAPEHLTGVLASTSLCFDLSVFELFVPLCCGGRVILSENALHLPTLPAAKDVTLINTVPSAIAELLRINGIPASVQTINLAGEPLSNVLVQQLYQQETIHQVFNLYGPSEDTTYSTFTLVKKGTNNTPTIGRPIDQTQVYILDYHLQPVPVGVAGELHISGAGLARGYLNRPDLTAEKFILNPFNNPKSKIQNPKLYKTGDLARYLPDGNIEYLGRIDNQVKIRGFRIELGEIEAVLSQHLAVQEFVVLVQEDVPGDKRLVAYVVPHQEQTPTVNELRSFLKQQLPEYMVPSVWVMLKALPRTLNGKVDRRALLALEIARPEMELVAAPRTPIEEVLAAIWADILGLEQVGIQDNFFELGGHSLLATQVMSRVCSAFQVALPLSSFFEATTIADLAKRVETAMLVEYRLPVPPIERVLRNTELGLSYAQQRLWFLDQLEPGNPFYNIPAAVRLQGQLNVVALEQSLNEVIKRHEALRTHFALKQQQPVQVIVPNLTMMLPMVDLRQLPPIEREVEVKRLATEESQRPFDLSQGPLFRVSLLLLNQEEHILLLTMHHIVSDGWSIEVLVRELTLLYEGFCTGKPSSLPKLPVQYVDFASWQKQWLETEVQTSLLTYWKQQLSGSLPVLNLPTNRPRPTVQTFRGARQVLVIPKTLTEPLKAMSQQENTTLFMTLLAAFKTLLYRYTRQEDILVGSPIANRTRTEIEGLIGFFVNTLVLRTDLSGNPSFRQLLHRVRKMAIAAYTHQDMPFEKLVEELQPERSLSHTPLFQVMFSLQNDPMLALEFSGLTLDLLDIESGTAKFDLTLDLTESPEGVKGWFEYNTDLFDADTISRMAGHFQTLLAGIVAHPEQQLENLPLLTQIEEHQLLVEWNNTKTDYPQTDCIHKLFEVQVKQNPDAIAAVFGDQQLSYRELNQRANQLAHYLQTLGVGPDVRVGICIERSLDTLIGIISILKAGGAYLPLDPAYPVERLAFMLKDAQVKILLTQHSIVANLSTYQTHVICLDTDWETIAQHSTNNLTETLHIFASSSAHLAYIIYTSGSTGQPKGVMVPHSSIVNRLLWGIQRYQLSPSDRLLQKTSLNFDVSVWEIFGALLAGATLVIAQPGGHQDPSYLVRVMAEQQITNVDFVPGMLRYILEEPGIENCQALRYVTCGGEALPVEVRDRFFARLPAVELHNCYGPTEVSIDATSWVCQPHSPVISIGGAIANQEVYILDANLQPMPIGVAGELYIGGAGLAWGYLNRPDLTAVNFIPHPFLGRGAEENQVSARLYKTGDLARYLPDGNIEFLGRLDDQVKIRGFRLELGEIEAVLRRFPDIDEVAVVVHTSHLSSEQRLVAYLTPKGQINSIKDIRLYLSQHLPNYMVPSAFVILPKLPRTPNGKLDYHALPAPDISSFEQTGFVPPRTPVEEAISNIWAEIIQVERVGVHDNFFELGGHSLLAIQVISKLRQTFGIELPLQSLFEATTVEKLSEVLIANETKLGKTEKIALVLKQIESMSVLKVKERLQQKRSNKN
ncbi:MAG: amino acid adenylation domain-containing protein [Nostoc sp.]|uniref:amino acid adenylation domain-containing protein n=1 Tax=Nostoc sp. TaxID=1180 RepID=UPI002FF2F3B1